MDHEKKLKFVHQMAKLGLQHFDGGGVISAGNSNPLSGVSGALTAQNTFSSNGPNMNQVIAGQNDLEKQLQNEAAGNGPNPAQMQYQQNAQNLAQQQAEMNAQNRAINPGLAARLSSNAAVSAGQQAAAGAAMQQAQQQLAAQGQLNQLYNQQAGTSLGAQGINAQVAQNNTNAVENTQGGLLKSIPLIGGLFGASGGMVPHMAKGGSVHVAGVPDFSNAGSLPDINLKSSPVQPNDPFAGMADNNFGASQLSQPTFGDSAGFGSSVGAPSLMGSAPAAAGPSLGIESLAADPAILAAAAYKGGEISESPQYPSQSLAVGGVAGPQSFAGQWLNGGEKMESGGLMKKGGPVQASIPKQKAKVKDDSLKNDKVPAMLSEGEIVIPRHITQHPMAPQKAAAFVQAVLNKRKMGGK